MDERITDGVRTLATMERGICRDSNDYEQLLYIQQCDDAHNNILFIKKHIMRLILCYSPPTADYSMEYRQDIHGLVVFLVRGEWPEWSIRTAPPCEPCS